MDVYFEYLIEMKKDKRSVFLLIAIWLLLAVILAVAVIFLINMIPLLALLFVVGIYGAVNLSKKLNGEYEYIFTNGEIDIDVIIGKSERRRIISFDTSEIERVELYNAEKPLGERETFNRVGMYCNKDDKNVYSLVVKHKKEGKICVTMDIPEKMQQKMLPFMDKLVARNAFKS